MGKRIVKVMAVLQLILCIVAYVSMSIHFNADIKIYSQLANTDFVATMLRLSLYIIPGVHLLSALYGLVFNDKKILLIICIVEIISCALTFTFIGSSQYMLTLSIVSTMIAVLYLVGILITK